MGSQATAYFALGPAGNSMSSSSSSETRMRTRPEERMVEMKMSLPITSSFFWSSPVEFVAPARPERLIKLARRM